MINKISVVFSSHSTIEENNDFIKHIKETIGNVDVQVFCYPNFNEYSLCEIYNKAWNHLKEIGRADGGIVFCHNDILFKTRNWGKLLLGVFNNTEYDILGVAGSEFLPSHGCWWKTEDGKEMNFKNMYGRVWHTNGIREFESIYSEKIMGVKETVIVDGLFIGVNGSTVGSKDEEMFDERFRGFHMYDISFCFRNYLNGFNIGVIDKISVLHKSVGQTNQQWEMNRIQFSLLYKDELPVKI